MWKILMFEISAKKGLRDVILGSEEKKVRFGSALFTQFWRCKYGFVYYSNVQRTFKNDKIKSTVFTRPHAMKHYKLISGGSSYEATDTGPHLSFWENANYYFFSENEIKFVSPYTSVTIRIGTYIVYTFIPNVGIRPIKSRSGSSDDQSAPQLPVHFRY